MAKQKKSVLDMAREVLPKGGVKIQEEDTKTISKNQKLINILVKETGITPKELQMKVEEKKTELKGLIMEESALFIIGKELGVDLKFPSANVDLAFGEETIEPEVVEAPKKAEPKITKEAEEIEFPMQVISDSEIQKIQYSKTLPTIEEVDAAYAMYKHVKNSMVDKSDFQIYQGKPRMKKSGYRKFVKPFSLSVDIIGEPKVYKTGELCEDGTPDIIAEVWVIVYQKITCPKCGDLIRGQSIEAFGFKEKSEYWSKRDKNFGGYNRHNLITTARTRAINQGIGDLVGFGEVSFEEIQSQPNNDEDLDVDSAFG